MYEAALFYYYGATNVEGTMSGWNYEQAMYWLRKVSESEDDLKYHADTIIARLYYLGEVPGEAQSLGNLLFWGRGCKADIMKAYEMYKKAYEHGFYDGLIMKEKIEKIKGWS